MIINNSILLEIIKSGFDKNHAGGFASMNTLSVECKKKKNSLSKCIAWQVELIYF